MTPIRSLAIAFLLVLSAAPSRGASPTPAEAFEKLSSLVGDWEAKTEKGTTIRVNYRLVSADSVLVQTYKTPSGRETITVFHRDGANLIATHYCAQGNQPRLRLDGTSGETSLGFVFMDATNLPDVQASHLRRLQFDFVDSDHYVATEIYSAEGKDEPGVLKFARVH